jgi:hypothetical protein
MALQSLTYGMPSGFVKGTFLPTKAWGSANLGGILNLPVVPAVDFELWPGTGSQAGKGDIVILASGTLTNVTPGTTDQADVDLQTALDVSGVAASADEVVHLAFLADTQADAARFVIEGNATNGWTAPFRDMVDPTLGKLSIPAGFTHPTSGQAIPGGLILWGGNLSSMPVTGTNKVLRVRLVAGTTGDYRLMLLGRSAAS